MPGNEVQASAVKSYPVSAAPPEIIERIRREAGIERIIHQPTQDGIPTAWVAADDLHSVLLYLKTGVDRPYRTLFDLTAIDERVRSHREGQPDSGFTVVYHLLSYERNEDIRLKVALPEKNPSIRTITDLWPAADWYEREVWDMFGIDVAGHPNLRRILMPPGWKGHPLRKDHPARATDMEPYHLDLARAKEEQELLRFRPAVWGQPSRARRGDVVFLNLGPQHPGTHGILRMVLELDEEVIVEAIPDIGFHHRGAEKMGERQSWHTYIPYTDRIDYLSGVLNNLAYLISLEEMAGIEVPERAQVIRVMMCELFRISSHLVWYGTFAQDLGQLSPVLYMFTDREKIMDIVEAVTGGRLHPSWFRIGGVAQDLPEGWESLVGDFLRFMPGRMAEYDRMVMQNRIFKARTQGVGAMKLDRAIEWGVTGPNLRACGLEWDFRKRRPYSGYDRFEFDIPTADGGDCYSRAVVHVEEIRQSLRIIEQCLKNMPPGPYKAKHPLATPPLKEGTMYDIETLIGHFLGVSWGPVVPPGEGMHITENAKGATGYYLISDGNTISYRTRIRTPSFAHLQTVPDLCRGLEVPDLIAILGSLDYVLGDVDR